MNRIKILIATAIIAAIILVGCKKDMSHAIYIKESSLDIVDINKDIEPSCYNCLKFLKDVIIKHMQGERRATVTGNHTVWNCNGFGTCEATIAIQNDGQSSDISNQNTFIGDGDYSTNCQIGITLDDKIIFRIHEDENNFNIVFHSDVIHFLSDPYIVDNKDFLTALELTKPFTIEGGAYQVYYTPDGYANIIIGNAK